VQSAAASDLPEQSDLSDTSSRWQDKAVSASQLWLNLNPRFKSLCSICLVMAEICCSHAGVRNELLDFSPPHDCNKSQPSPSKSNTSF
jgi:hypothetical protein